MHPWHPLSFHLHILTQTSQTSLTKKIAAPGVLDVVPLGQDSAGVVGVVSMVGHLPLLELARELGAAALARGPVVVLVHPRLVRHPVQVVKPAADQSQLSIATAGSQSQLSIVTAGSQSQQSIVTAGRQSQLSIVTAGSQSQPTCPWARSRAARRGTP